MESILSTTTAAVYGWIVGPVRRPGGDGVGWGVYLMSNRPHLHLGIYKYTKNQYI